MLIFSYKEMLHVSVTTGQTSVTPIRVCKCVYGLLIRVMGEKSGSLYCVLYNPESIHLALTWPTLDRMVELSLYVERKTMAHLDVFC